MNQYEVKYTYQDEYKSWRGGSEFINANTEEQAINILRGKMPVINALYSVTYTTLLVKRGIKKLPRTH